MEVKPVPSKEMSDSKQNSPLLNGHMQFCLENYNEERRLVPEKIDNLID